jgi:hypothetical protein
VKLPAEFAVGIGKEVATVDLKFDMFGCRIDRLDGGGGARQRRHELFVCADRRGHSRQFVLRTVAEVARIDIPQRVQQGRTVDLETPYGFTYFRPLEHNGYTLVDGGVWANNPAMLAVIEALICFDIDRDQIDLLSLGCGEDPYVVSDAQMHAGGKLAWSDVVFAAMRLQSLSAINQARLLLGPPLVHRIDPPPNPKPILLDDFRRALDELVPAAKKAVDEQGERIATTFLSQPASSYEPVPIPAS